MKKHIKLMSLILLILIIIISGSYAFYSGVLNKSGNATGTLSTKKLSLHFSDSTEINLQGILPGQTVIKEFSVTNNGNETVSYNLLFKDVINELNRTSDLVYSLVKDNESLVSEEVFPTEDSNLYLSISIAPTITQNFKLIIEYKNATVNQGLDMDKLICTTIELSMNDLSDNALYNENIHEFVAPKDGYYRLEAWGAQGGSAGNVAGGYGAYTKGEIYLHQGDVLMAVVGGAGATNTYDDETIAGGFNGGGASVRNSNGDATDATRGSGGGASHIAIKNINYTTLDTYNDKTTLEDYVLIVAGGGGGSAKWQSDHNGQGGNGGGYLGNEGTVTHEGDTGRGGTQSAGGIFGADFGLGGTAQSYVGYNNYAGGSGGGGGLYGGGYSKDNAGAGGGSGYINMSKLISGYMVCKDCAESTATATYTKAKTCVSANPEPDCSKMGAGAVKITYVQKVTVTLTANYNDINLGSLLIDKGTLLGDLDLDYDDFSNYILEGCYLDSGYNNLISDNTNAVINGNMTIYCKYKPCFKKSYTASATDTFTANEAGTYKIEAWGAQGGNATGIYVGGYGGYATGLVTLAVGDHLYINVGQAGSSCPPQTVSVNGGYNGGGKAYHNANGDGSGSLRGSGGGATSVTISNRGELKEYNSYRDEILLVAGGGGGASSWSTQYGPAGNGGGATATNGRLLSGDGTPGTGATQLAGGSVNGTFGKGGDAIQSPGWGNSGGAGGGGGYFGGGYGKNNAGAGGGSGYINTSVLTNAEMACVGCTANTSTEAKTNNVDCHYEKATPGCGKEGDGYIRIYKAD